MKLCGGYAAGHVIFSKLDWASESTDGRTVQAGDQGKVLGKSTSKGFDLSVQFPNASAMNAKISEISLAGGFTPGTDVYSKIQWSGDDRRVKVGDKGRVLGPATLQERDLLVQFPNASTLNVNIFEISLVGGYSPGHTAYSKIAWSGAGEDRRTVVVGDKGEVLGPAQKPGFDLLMKFPNAATLSVRTAEVSLVGGFVPGNVIYSKICWSGGKSDKRRVKVGDKGTVLGPATIEGHDLLVKFPKAASLNVSTPEISRTELRISSADSKQTSGVGSSFTYAPGDVICSRVKWHGSGKDERSVGIGDVGVILGPASLDGFEFTAKFSTASKLNVKALEISFVGGYAPGDVVHSKIQYCGKGKDGRFVKVGERGTVIGSANSDDCYDLRVTFQNASEIKMKLTELGSAAKAEKQTVEETALEELVANLGKVSISEIEQCLDPQDIRYCQDSISQRFQGGLSIHGTLRELQLGLLSVWDIPHMHVFKWNGNNVYSADNRRLWVFKALGQSIPVTWVTLASVDSRKLTTTNHGRSVSLR